MIAFSPFKFKTLGIFSLVVLTLSSIFSVSYISKLINNYQWVSHTHEVLLGIETISSSIKEAETNIRGFIVTKDTVFLATYWKNYQSIQANYKHLKELTQDNALQQSHLLALRIEIDEKYKIFKGQIQQNAKNHHTLTLQGRIISNRIYQIIRQMRKEESKLLEARTHEMTSRERYIFVALIISFVLAFLLLCLLFYIMYAEIMERTVIEKELKKAKNIAVNATEVKSRFLANMSHEIRTPLNAILGFTSILKKEDTTQETREEYLNHISSSGTLLLKLIGDILDLSKIEEGKLELTTETFFFKEVILSGIMPYKFKVNEKGLDFELTFDNNVPHYVKGDAHRIQQIIVNLIGNALKFTSEGKIGIAVTNLSQDKWGEEALIRVSVCDTGIGIPPEKQATIFETFTQADTSIQREFGGSGLGLSIVKQLVALMKGEIGIISPNGNTGKGGLGSTFWFTLPLQIDKNYVKPTPILEREENPEKNLPSWLKVLVVEDNMVNQRLAKVVLKNLGIVPEFANNGKEAIEKTLQEHYNIILMDVQMPVMDGYEATAHLRKKMHLEIPIIGLTANVFKDDIENCLRSGMNDYLGKPYSEEQLFEMISKWTSFN